MRANRLKHLWRAGGQALVGWLTLGDSFTAELMARQGFDALCIDLQHGLATAADLVPMLQALGQTETVPLVRVPWNDPAIIMKVLDAGAYGVIVPLVNDRGEAERAVAACRYPPQGIRSFGPIRAAVSAGPGYAEAANDEVLCFIMIETALGLANRDAICATPGLDGIYIGPSDLALALGLPPLERDAPAHAAAVADILASSRRHGLVAGIHTNGPASAARYLSQGFGWATLTSDAQSLNLGASQQLRQLREGASVPGSTTTRADPYT